MVGMGWIGLAWMVMTAKKFNCVFPIFILSFFSLERDG